MNKGKFIYLFCEIIIIYLCYCNFLIEAQGTPEWFSLGGGQRVFRFGHIAGFTNVPHESWGDRRMVIWSGQRENYAVSGASLVFNYGKRVWVDEATNDGSSDPANWPDPRLKVAYVPIQKTSLYLPSLPDNFTLENITIDENATDSHRYLFNFSPFEEGTSQIFVYGGLRGLPTKEINLFNMVTGEWDNTPFTQDPSNITDHFDVPTAGASAVFDGDDTVWLFGGKGEIVQSNFVSRVSLSQKRIYAVNLTNLGGPIPSSRWGHVAALYNKERMYIFGGRRQFTDEAPRILGDVFIFNTTNTGWIPIGTANNNKPAARSFASSAVSHDGQRWYIYGGVDDTNPAAPIYYDDLYSLTFSSGTWQQITPTGTGPTTGRAEHTMVPLYLYDRDNFDELVEESYIIYGGRDSTGAVLGDIFKLQFLGKANGLGDGDGILPGEESSSLPFVDDGEPSLSTVETGEGDGTDNTALIAALATTIPCCVLCIVCCLIIACAALIVAYTLHMKKVIKKMAQQEGAELS